MRAAMKHRLAPLVRNRSACAGLVLLAIVVAVALIGPRRSRRRPTPFDAHRARRSTLVVAPLRHNPRRQRRLLSGADRRTADTRADRRRDGNRARTRGHLRVRRGGFPGRADTVLSAVTGIFLALPILPLAIVVAGVLPQGRHTAVATMLMIGLAAGRPRHACCARRPSHCAAPTSSRAPS